MNKFGIMSINSKTLSSEADYIQLDICGLLSKEVLARYQNYRTNIPVILHGDWTKKGCSENNFFKRADEYKEIIKTLQFAGIKILGFTIHPITKNRGNNLFDDFVNACDKLFIDTEIPVFIENRSSSKIFLSSPKEIEFFSSIHKMTIDIPQLFISCNFSNEMLKKCLKNINLNNVKELHLGNVIRKDNHTYVARNLYDGEIDYSAINFIFTEEKFITFEILGGNTIFNKNKFYFRKEIL